MATAADYLVTALTNACQRLAEIDAASADVKARGVVDSDGVRWDWNAYRASLLAEVKDLTDQIGKVRTATAGPWTVTTGTVRG